MKFCLISGPDGKDVKHIFINEAKKIFDEVLYAPIRKIRIVFPISRRTCARQSFSFRRALLKTDIGNCTTAQAIINTPNVKERSPPNGISASTLVWTNEEINK